MQQEQGQLYPHAASLDDDLLSLSHDDSWEKNMTNMNPATTIAYYSTTATNNEDV